MHGNLETDAPPRRRLDMRLCSSCLCVVSSTETICGSCGERSLIPYLDRRPLLLDRSIRDGILDLIDEAVTELSDDSEVLEHMACVYLPFLQQALEDAERAEALRTEGNVGGFRVTACSKDEVLEHIKNLRLPPSVR